MALTPRFRSIFLRVLAMVLAAGLVALSLSTAVTVAIVIDDKDASLGESALAQATRTTDELDRRIERTQAELAAVALAADAGRPFEARELVGSDVIAMRVERGAEVLLEAAEDRATRERLAGLDLPAREVQLLSETELLLRREIGDLRVCAIVDASTVIASIPSGWTLSLGDELDAPLGVEAQRARVGGEESVRVRATSERGLTVALVAPLEPARSVARGIITQVLVWSWAAVLPLVLIAFLLARRVTAPIRALADAVERSDGEHIELPPLGRDEIGELGAAIDRLSTRLRQDARAMGRAERFARHAGRMRTPEEIFGALRDVLTRTVPHAKWHVISMDDVVAGTIDPRVAVPRSLLELTMAVPGEEDSAVGILQPRGRESTLELPDVSAVDELALIPLRNDEDKYGIVIGSGFGERDASDSKIVQLLCRVAVAALRNEALAREALASEKLTALGRLAASVAHEINNPLSSVLANLHALEGDLEGEALEVANDARRGADTVAAIVRDLSLLARGGRGVSLVDADLVAVADAALEKLSVERTGIHFELDAPHELPLSCSATRIEQALINLIGNAADAVSSRLRPEIKVSVRKVRDRAVVRVGDNGHGISPAVKRRLFEPFVTGKGDRGTGLGLYLARTFARTHGGDVEMTSTNAEGTTFELWVPLRTGLAARAPVSEPAPTKRVHLLMVDDDPAVLRATTRWLSKRADLTTTTDPQKALELIEEREPDLVLCDLEMTPMHGRELAAAIAERWPHLALRVVFVSGAADAANDAFQKPLRQQDVDRILRRARRRPAPVAVEDVG